MEDKIKKKYSFARMLFYSAVIIFVFYFTDFFAFHITTEDQFMTQNTTQDFSEQALENSSVEQNSDYGDDSLEKENLQADQNETVGSGESISENTIESGDSESQTLGKEEKKPLVLGDSEVDRSYFDNALFIGDSRTEGLYEYGDLQNATVMAASGMSVYKIYNHKFEMADGTKKTVEQIVDEKEFGKIYLMLGINELGYDFKATVKKYQELVQWLELKEPEAIIYLEANMHITEEKSLESDYCTNENINAFNQAIKGMADGKKKFYLDVNSLFDNEKGSLDQNYTSDQSHVLGKYYKNWVDWLLTEAR